MLRSTYAVAIGSNRPGRHGAPAAEVRAAIAALKGIVTAEAIVASAPVGPSTRRFANTVVVIETDALPEELLGELKAIEARFGRRSGRRWGARVIDLDIVLWSGGAWRSPGLIIPHVAYRDRAFVLAPLTCLAAAWRDPLTGLTPRHLLARLTRRRALPRRAPCW